MPTWSWSRWGESALRTGLVLWGQCGQQTLPGFPISSTQTHPKCWVRRVVDLDFQHRLWSLPYVWEPFLLRVQYHSASEVTSSPRKLDPRWNSLGAETAFYQSWPVQVQAWQWTCCGPGRQAWSHSSSPWPYEIDTILTPTLQMGKLRAERSFTYVKSPGQVELAFTCGIWSVESRTSLLTAKHVWWM